MPKKRVLAVAIAAALSGYTFEGRAQSIAPTTLPTGGRVVGGQASITQSGASMTVQQATNRAALDWQTFNIGSQAAVRFDQPSASSIALNNILGNNASQIYGSLTSNGQVFLLNPNGVLFGRGAQVDVGGLLASTLKLSPDDFMRGSNSLSRSGSIASIVNEGKIRTAPGGYVALVGPTLRNDGTIESTGGTVSMTAANAATLEYMADGLVRIRVNERALQSEVTNNGIITADGGGVYLTATAMDSLARAVVNNTGLIEARTVETVNGVVRLGGGKVELAGNTVLVDGRVDVSAAEGKGGSIKVLGDKVGLIGGAQLDASGATGGGEILIGGNYQGKGPEQNASAAYVGQDVRIDASATARGDGGKVIVWSNENTQFDGRIAARGGAQSGNGGFVETSGGTLNVTGAVDASAPNGKTGTWLLDPKDLIVSNTGSPYAAGANNLFANNSSGTSTITATSISASTSNVLLQANNDVTFSDPVNITNLGTGLTAQAGRSIFVNANITTNSGNINLTANDDSGSVVAAQRSAGAGGITMAIGTAVNAGGADIRLRVGTGTSGADQTAGNVIISSLTGGRVGIIHDAFTSGTSITRSDPTSLVSANQFFIDSEAASIGTSLAPIRISTPILEAHYHAASGGIYIDSPNGEDLQIGGVDPSFFGGLVRGVQAGDGVAGGSGPIRITVNGNLTQLAGGAGCGLTGGAGGPICAPNGDITLTANGTVTLNSVLTAASSFGASTLDITGTGVVANGAVVSVTGGSAGLVGVHPANVNITATAGNITWTGGSITATGGSDTAPANKDDANITLTASNGGVSVSNATFSVSGGNPDIELTATGALSISNSTLAATSVHETATIFVYSSGDNVSLTNSSLSAIGTEPGTIGNDADTTNVGVVARHDLTVAGTAITANGGTGIGEVLLFAGSSVNFDLGQFDALGGGNLNVNTGSSISSTSGIGPSHSGTIGRAVLTGDNVSIAAGVPVTVSAYMDGILAIDAFNAVNVGGNLSVTSANGRADVDIAGPTFAVTQAGSLNLLSGSTISASGPGGTTTVSAEVAGSITIGGNISTSGQVLGGSPGQGGIFLTAGDAIVGAGGILNAVSTGGPTDAYISLQAVNGIGTVANPIRVDQGDLWAANTGTTVGDLAISLVSGDLNFNPLSGDNLNGFYTNAASGTYLLQLENGSLTWNGSFSPNSFPLLSGQSVQFKTLNGNITMAPGSSIQTFGAGNITLFGNNTTASGSGVFLSGPTSNLSQPKSMLQASGTGNITITGTSATGAGVFVGGDIDAAGGNVSITGTGATVGGSGTNTVAGVTNPLVGTDLPGEWNQAIPRVHSGGTLTITGTGGTTTGTGNATGVGFGGNNATGNFGHISMDGDQGVSIDGTGGTSAAGGAAGVAINSGSVNWGSHIGSGSGGNITITGHGGTASGANGAVGVAIGGGNDVVSSDVGSFGQIFINGFGGTSHNVFGTSNNVGANGVVLNHGIVESTGGITIFGQAGTATVDNATLNGSGTGVGILASTVRAAQAGNISIHGVGRTGAGVGNASGVGISDGAVVQTQGIDIPELGGFTPGTGSITIQGEGGGFLLGSGATGTGGANGIAVSHFNTTNGASILSNTGTISLTGQGGNAGSGEARGIVLRANGGTASSIESTGGGAIFLTGTGGNAASTGSASTTGVAIGNVAGSPSLVRTSGDIVIDGTGGTNTGTTSSSGVGVSDGSMIQALSAGNLTIAGEGGTAGAGGANGIVIAPFNTTSGASVSTNSGTLTLNGLVGSATGPSLALRLNDSVVSTASGAMVVNATGNVAVIASNAAGANTPTLLASGGTQSITITSGSLTLQGASVGSGAAARVVSTGNQAISADSISLHAGDAGGADGSGNTAQIVSNTGTQTITTTAGDLTLTAGLAGINNGAVIVAPTQNITVHGNLSLTGGGSDPTTVGSGARIGGLGGASPGATNLTLQVDGNATLTGGSFAGASGVTIGASGTATALATNISANIDGNLTMTMGSVSGTTFGSPNNNTGGGNTSLTVGGDIALTGANNIHSSGTLSVGATGVITLTGGSGTNQSSVIQSEGDQTVTAASITLTGGGAGSNNFARIQQSGTSANQTVSAGTITLNGGADGGGLTTGNFVQIRNKGLTQTVNVGSGGLHINGGGGTLTDNSAVVWQEGASGSQLINVSGGGAIVLQGGSSAQSGIGSTGGSFAAITSDGVLQHIDFTAPGGSISITGGTVGSRNAAVITSRTAGQSQTITGSPTITMTGGASGGVTSESNDAKISSAGTQTVTAGAVTINGGGGLDASAGFRAPTQNITTGNLTLNGGTDSEAGARIGSSGGSTTNLTLLANGDIILNANNSGAALGGDKNSADTTNLSIHATGNITMTASANNGTRIGSSPANPAGGTISVTTDGSLSLNGNAAFGSAIRTLGDLTVNAAQLSITDSGITSGNAGVGTQQINVTNGLLIDANAAGSSISSSGTQTVNAGSLTIDGGTAVGKNAGIFNNSGNQTVSVGGTITLTGGTAPGATGQSCQPTGGSCAIITNTGAGLQSISANAVTMTAGSGGTANNAAFFVNGGPEQVTIGAGGLTMLGGAGAEASAIIGGGGANGQTVTVNVTGNTTMTGGSGNTSGALIGLGGTGAGNSVTVNFGGTGNLTLTAGTGTNAVALIGAAGTQTTAITNLNITAADIALNDSTSTVSRFGHSGSAPGGGNISVTATTGNIALNSANAMGSAIRTQGNVTMTAAGAISEGPQSVVAANLLVANASSGISMNGNNVVGTLLASNNTSGDIQFTQAAGNLLTVGGLTEFGGNVTLTADDLNITGGVNASASTVVLRPTTLSQNINLEFSPTGGLSLSPSDIGFVTANVLEIGRNDNTGTGNMTISAFPNNAQANAGTYRMFATDINVVGGLGGTGSEFPRNFELRASNNLNVIDSTLLFADGANVALVADNDNSGVGDLTISDSLGFGNDRTVLAGTSAANTASMLLQGRNITVINTAGATMTVDLRGAGTQTVTTPGILVVQAGGIDAQEGGQSINAQTINVLAGGTFGHIMGSTQNITAGSGGILVQGGTGTGNNASISQQSPSGTQTITVNGGSLVIQGSATGSNNSADVSAQGTTQTISVPTGSILVQGGGVPNNDASINQSGGAQSIGAVNITVQDGSIQSFGSQGITATGVLSVLSNGVDTRVQSDGPQVINANGLSIIAGATAGTHAQVFGGSGQTVNSTYVEVIAQNNNFAALDNQSGNQSITTSGVNGSGEGIVVKSLSGAPSQAEIFNFGAGTQTITMNNGDYLRVIGRAGTAHIIGNAGGAVQSITLQGSGLNSFEMGSADGLDTGTSQLSGSNQQIIAGQSGQNGAITVRGGQTDNAFNSIFVTSGTQSISTSGTLTLIGGTAPSFGSTAQISSMSGGSQTIGANGIVLLGGASGSQNRAGIQSQGGQTITVGAGGITMVGGSGGDQNNAYISQQVTGNQTITVNGGSISMTGGGGGAQNGTAIEQFNPAGTQTITMNGGGSIVLQGGSGSNQASANIESSGVSQQINFPSGGTLDLTGGTVGTDNWAGIEAQTGNLTITGSPTITLTGGASGGAPNQPNSADLHAQAGNLTISANSISITGGAGFEGNASIGGATVNITTGALTLQGGTGTGAIAAVGSGESSTDITINAGSITMKGGSGGMGSFGYAADALIGAASGFDANVTLNVTGAMLVSKDASSGFGNYVGSEAGGTININAGSLAFGGVMRTTGAITLNSAGVVGFDTASVQAGTLAITGGGTTQVTGGTTTFQIASPFTNNATLNIAPAATLATANSDLINGATGVITGTGTVDVGSGTLINNGLIAPAGAGTVGNFAVTGNYAQGSTGALAFDIASGISYDTLSVTGSATLDGTLNATTIGGFTPNGESFAVMAYGSRSGSFATLNVPANFQPTYNLTNFTLTHSLVGGDFWTNAVGDFLWTTPGNWSLSRIPVSTDDVTLAVVAGSEARVTSGAHTIATLTSSANNSLLINGGSLTVLGSANLLGPTTVQSGTLTLQGSSALAGTTLSGGNFNVTATANASTLAWTGGTIGGGGVLTVLGALDMPAGQCSNCWNHTFLAGTTLNANGATTFGSGQNFGGNGADLTLSGGAVVNNNGTWALDYANVIGSGATDAFNNLAVMNAGTSGFGGTVTALLNNSGTVNINGAGDGLSLTSGGTSSGTFNIGTGATLFLAGGTSIFNGNVLGSAGTLSVGSGSTAQVNGAVNVGQLNLPGGLLNGSGNVTVTSSYTQTSGIVNLGGALSITQASGGLSLGAINAGSLTIASAGAITQSAPIVVAGATSVNAGANAIVLINAGNDFQGAVTAVGAGISISDANALTITLTDGGLTTLTAGSITSSDLVTMDLTLNTVNGASLAAMHLGTPSLEGGLTVSNTGSGNVDLTNVGLLNVRAVTNTGGGFTLDNTGNVRVSVPANTAGLFKIMAHSNIDLQANITANTSGTANPAIDLQAMSPGSVITQNAGTTLDGNSGAVLLSAASGVTTQGTLTGGSASITTSGGAVQLGTTTTTGALNVSTSGGDITQTGTLSVGGTSSLQASSGSVDLPSTTNTFTGAVSATGTGSGGVIIATSGTLIPATINAGASTVDLDAGSLAAGGPITASSAILNSDTNVSGVSLVNVASVTLTGSAASWSFLADAPLPTVISGPTPTFSPLTALPPPLPPTNPISNVVSSTISNTTNSTNTTTNTSSSTVTNTSFSTTLAPDAASGPVQIATAPSTSTASTSSAPSDTSSTSTQSSEPAQDTSTTQSSSQSGGRQQTASVQRSTTTQPGRTTLSAAAAQLVASMNELRAQKVQALEKGVEILERNPAAADLKPCSGSQLAGDCIAQRPAKPRAAANARQPVEANLPQIQRKVALLIGVSDYRGGIPKLNSPIKDIQEIGKIYREQFGYEVRTLPNGDKASIVRALNRLILESGPNDSITVMYAGHGQIVEKTGRGYWIPARASADDPTQWISNQDIGKALENISARQVLLVSDSCYSGTLTRDAKVRRAEVLNDPAQVLEKRSVTVLSSGGEEPVADAGRDGHSVFAWHFMQTLRGVEKLSNGVDVYERLTGSVTQEFPQEPQYGEALGSGHERGGDYLFEVRRY